MKYSICVMLAGMAIIAMMLAITLNASDFLWRATRTGVLVLHLIALIVAFRTFRHHDLRATAFLAGSWVFLAYNYIVCRMDEYSHSLATTQLHHLLWQAIRVENPNSSPSSPQFLPEWAYFNDIDVELADWLAGCDGCAGSQTRQTNGRGLMESPYASGYSRNFAVAGEVYSGKRLICQCRRRKPCTVLGFNRRVWVLLEFCNSPTRTGPSSAGALPQNDLPRSLEKGESLRRYTVTKPCSSARGTAMRRRCKSLGFGGLWEMRLFK